MKKLQTFDLSYFYLGALGKIFGRKSKGLLEESMTTPATSVNSFTPKFTYILNSKIAEPLTEIIWISIF